MEEKDGTPQARCNCQKTGFLQSYIMVSFFQAAKRFSFCIDPRASRHTGQIPTSREVCNKTCTRAQLRLNIRGGELVSTLLSSPMCTSPNKSSPSTYSTRGLSGHALCANTRFDHFSRYSLYRSWKMEMPRFDGTRTLACTMSSTSTRSSSLQPSELSHPQQELSVSRSQLGPPDLEGAVHFDASDPSFAPAWPSSWPGGSQNVSRVVLLASFPFSLANQANTRRLPQPQPHVSQTWRGRTKCLHWHLQRLTALEVRIHPRFLPGDLRGGPATRF